MKNITVVTTNCTKKEYWKEETVPMQEMQDCMHVINVCPEVQYQKFRGFGGAFTEASAHVYNLLNEDQKKEFIRAYFGKEGLRYNMGRIHMNSCDFALGNYTYVEENDDTLETFDISHDRKQIIPMIKDAEAEAGKKLTILMSPWSPPAYMKTNQEMNHGGKLKAEYRKLWAEYYVKFIKEYRAEDIDIQYLTVQNEPMAVQTWDSCIYTGREEGEFVKEYLGPAMEQAGLDDVSIFVWDHNKEETYQRMKEVVYDEEVAKYVKGEALHWYTGDHFEAIEMVKKQYPDMEIFFTEGCVEYSRFADSDDIRKAEMYAHDILGNMNAGINASLDWNLLLDEKGGPNHVGNFCMAPIMQSAAEEGFEKQLAYYYIGQFSRYIQEDAVRVGTTRYTDAIEVTGFLNPDNSRVVVVLNKSEQEVSYTLREWDEKEQKYMGIERVILPHSIQTVCYE